MNLLSLGGRRQNFVVLGQPVYAPDLFCHPSTQLEHAGVCWGALGLGLGVIGIELNVTASVHCRQSTHRLF